MTEPFRKSPPLTSFRGTVIRWTLICIVCAAPSFYFGLASIALRYIPSMLLGVATFVVFYTALDWGTRFHPLRQNRWVLAMVKEGVPSQKNPHEQNKVRAIMFLNLCNSGTEPSQIVQRYS